MLVRIAATIFILLGTSTQIHSKGASKSLKKWYEDAQFGVNFLPDSNPIGQFLKSVDKRCLEGEMNAFEEKVFSKIEAVTVALPALLKCLEGDSDKIFESLLEGSRKMLKNFLPKEDLECYKWKLQQLEPKSRILEDFKTENMKKSVDDCRMVIETAENILGKLLADLSSKDSKNDCGMSNLEDASTLR